MKEVKLKITFYTPEGKFNFEENVEVNIPFNRNNIEQWVESQYVTSKSNNYTVEAWKNNNFIGFLKLI